jgi:hypothetical protein
MNLDFSKLTAHLPKSWEQWEQREQPITARLPVFPDRKSNWEQLGTGSKEDSPPLLLFPLVPSLFPDENTLKPLQIKDVTSVPSVPAVFSEIVKTETNWAALCELLGLSLEQVEGAEIFDFFDYGLIDEGHYNAFWVIRYLLSWRAGGYFVTFGVLSDEAVKEQLDKLQLSQPAGETVNQWLFQMEVNDGINK